MKPPVHVLMIEDSADDADLLARELEQFGFDAHCRRVDSASALRDALAERAWDVVLADYTLPGFEGLDALRTVRSLNATVPLIVVSGTIGEEKAVETIREGATDYLLKDRLGRLGPAIARAIEEHRLSEERRRAERQEALVTSISRALIESESLEETIDRTLQALCERLDWEWSAIWRIDEEKEVLRCLSIWHQPWMRAAEFETVSRETRFRPGEGLPGRVWRSGQPAAIEDIERDDNFPRKRLASANGIRSGFAFPIRLAGKPIGVVELFSTAQRSPVRETFDVLETIGSFVGQQVERQRADEALRSEREMLSRRVQEQTADISRANAELARASRLKDEFLANMSHELRTPLNAVLGLSEALLDGIYGPLTPKQRSTLVTIEESGRHLLDLISDILDLSKIEAGKLELDIQPVGVEEVCKASLAFVSHAAHKKRLEVAFEVAAGVRRVRADERRLKQILVNLLTNAVKFTPDGGSIGLTVEAGELEEHVRFQVWDTGVGIREEDLPRLCRPFVQLDSSLSRTHAGTGLGLSLVHRMAEMHGGALSIESEHGEGSRFTVTLPGSSAMDEENDAGPERSAWKPDSSISTAVIVEDSTEGADQLRRYLKDMAIDSTICLDSRDAIETIERVRPGVVFLDLLMPGIGGWEILRRLKADSRLSGIPTVLVSVVDEPKLAMTHGAAGYLVKPITRMDVARVLDRARPRRPDSKEPAPSGGHTNPAFRTSGPLVLLAEDNEFNIGVFSDYLRACGYQIVVARNGAEAVERALEHRPDVVLMDVQMPVLDGLEAIRRIRGTDEIASVPVIAITALAMRGDRQRCLDAGANKYMSKPVGMKALRAAIDEMLRRPDSPSGGVPEMSGA